MKLWTKKFSHYTLWLACLGLLICTALSDETSAQKTRPAPKPKPKVINKTKEFVLLSFEVTVNGDGEYSGTTKNRRRLWNLGRSYSGTVKLDCSQFALDPKWSQAEMLENIKTEKIMAWTHCFDPITDIDLLKAAKANGSEDRVPMQVDILDGDIVYSLDKGEGESFEKYIVRSFWEGKDTAYIFSPEVILDRKSSTYNVNIRIMPTSDRAQLSYKMTTEVSRSDFGYGNLPTSESTLDIDKKMSFNGLTMPRVDGLLADTVIHHPANLPLTFVDGHIDFDSGDVKFFPFGPKNGSATIIVRYRLEIVKNK